mmetsp:Transcript_42513/g.102409  ORF Transcript_42513/g.102409 Transcript_42513/m.102409 type:complete len:279 (-) Transcript_42513:741-1577(-)
MRSRCLARTSSSASTVVQASSSSNACVHSGSCVPSAKPRTTSLCSWTKTFAAVCASFTAACSAETRSRSGTPERSGPGSSPACSSRSRHCSAAVAASSAAVSSSFFQFTSQASRAARASRATVVIGKGGVSKSASCCCKSSGIRMPMASHRFRRRPNCSLAAAVRSTSTCSSLASSAFADSIAATLRTDLVGVAGDWRVSPSLARSSKHFCCRSSSSVSRASFSFCKLATTVSRRCSAPSRVSPSRRPGLAMVTSPSCCWSSRTSRVFCSIFSSTLRM